MKNLFTLIFILFSINETYSQVTIDDVALNICECVNNVEVNNISEEKVKQINQKCFQVHCGLIQDSLARANNLTVESVIKKVYYNLLENCESVKIAMTSMLKYKLPEPEYDSKECPNYRDSKIVQNLNGDESVIDFRSENSAYSINWINECDYEFIIKDKLGPLEKGEKITFTFIGVKADTSYYSMNMKGIAVTVKQAKIE